MKLAWLKIRGSTLSKTEVAWEKLFEKYKIMEHVDNTEVFKISAQQIREFREPRLMTKFDWSASRPKIFSDAKLSILPDTRGSYVIGRFKAYQKLALANESPKVEYLPQWVRSFDNFEITSESVALNVAQMSGMIDQVLEREQGEPQAVSTLTGRLKSGNISYKIQDISGNYHNFAVDNSQVEIDAGFEDVNNLVVIEAKNRIPIDFIIRQLYYPYRLYRNLQTGKKVVPIYFTYADQVFTFYVYDFIDPNNYSSIHKVNQYSFILGKKLDLTLDVVKSISQQSKMISELPNVPYPQANSIPRIIDSIHYLRESKNAAELAHSYGYAPRQGRYYGNALRFLNMAREEKGKFYLTTIGKKVETLPNSNERNKIIIEQMLNHKTIKLILDHTLRNNGNPDHSYNEYIIKENISSINSDETIHRRTETIESWINWILTVIE